MVRVGERRDPSMKGQEISSADWRRRFAGDSNGDPEGKLVARSNAVADITHPHDRPGPRHYLVADGPATEIAAKAASAKPCSRRKSSKLVGDVPGSHVLENRDVRDPIVQYLQVHGWLVYKNWQGPYSYPGVPDVTAIRDGEVWMIECKRRGGVLSSAQERFRDDWVGHGGKWMKAERVEDVEWMAKRSNGNGQV